MVSACAAALARQVSIFSFDFVVREPEELKLELEKHSARLFRIAKQDATQT
jgi:hypothetical protein